MRRATAATEQSLLGQNAGAAGRRAVVALVSGDPQPRRDVPSVVLLGPET